MRTIGSVFPDFFYVFERTNARIVRGWLFRAREQAIERRKDGFGAWRAWKVVESMGYRS